MGKYRDNVISSTELCKNMEFLLFFFTRSSGLDAISFCVREHRPVLAPITM